MERSRWSSTHPTRALSSTPPTDWPLFPQHQRTVKHLSCLQSISAVHSPCRLHSCRPERPGRETPCCGDCLGLSGIRVQRVHPELCCFSSLTGRGHAGGGQQLPPCIYPNFLLFLGCLSWCVVSCQLACESVPGQAMLGTDDAIFLQMREWGRQVHRLRCSHAPGLTMMPSRHTATSSWACSCQAPPPPTQVGPSFSGLWNQLLTPGLTRPLKGHKVPQWLPLKVSVSCLLFNREV